MGGARSERGAERCGERGNAVSDDGATRATGMVSNALTGIGETFATTVVTVIFFGGQSMFLKLGAREAVSSFWPIRVSEGTHTSRSTLSNASARAARRLDGRS